MENNKNHHHHYHHHHHHLSIINSFITLKRHRYKYDVMSLYSLIKNNNYYYSNNKNNNNINGKILTHGSVFILYQNDSGVTISV